MNTYTTYLVINNEHTEHKDVHKFLGHFEAENIKHAREKAAKYFGINENYILAIKGALK